MTNNEIAQANIPDSDWNIQNNTALDASTKDASIHGNSTQHASLGNDDANQAGSFFVELPAPLSYEQLAEHLIEKGLATGEDEKARIECCLADNGYYRLRGYWMTLEKNKRFLRGTTFEDILQIAELDGCHWDGGFGMYATSAHTMIVFTIGFSRYVPPYCRKTVNMQATNSFQRFWYCARFIVVRGQTNGSCSMPIWYR